MKVQFLNFNLKQTRLFHWWGVMLGKKKKETECEKFIIGENIKVRIKVVRCPGRERWFGFTLSSP